MKNSACQALQNSPFLLSNNKTYVVTWLLFIDLVEVCCDNESDFAYRTSRCFFSFV